MFVGLSHFVAGVRKRRAFVLAASLAIGLSAQPSIDTKDWTAEQDHRNMMDQLHIKALRPGPSGNESAPNHANYD